jgi:hypothetical protein
MMRLKPKRTVHLKLRTGPPDARAFLAAAARRRLAEAEKAKLGVVQSARDQGKLMPCDALRSSR